MVIAVAASAMIFLLLRRSPWEEALLSVSVSTAVVYLFYLHFLYVGASLDADTSYSLPFLSFNDWVCSPYNELSSSSFSDPLDLFPDLGDGVVLVLIGLLAYLLTLFVLTLGVFSLVWLGVNLVLTSYFVLVAPLLYAFTTSTRYLTQYSDHCRGSFLRSAWYAAPPALGKGIFIAALLHLTHLAVG